MRERSKKIAPRSMERRVDAVLVKKLLKGCEIFHPEKQLVWVRAKKEVVTGFDLAAADRGTC